MRHKSGPVQRGSSNESRCHNESVGCRFGQTPAEFGHCPIRFGDFFLVFSDFTARFGDFFSSDMTFGDFLVKFGDQAGDGSEHLPKIRPILLKPDYASVRTEQRTVYNPDATFPCL